MTLSCLSSRLNHFDASRRLWVSPTDEHYSAGDLKTSLTCDVKSFAGKRVVIEISDPLALAKSLVALDGVCESMLLLPTGLKAEEKAALRQRSSCTSIVTESDLVGWKPTNEDVDRTRSTNWILATSGTTGQPKLVEHTLASLTQSASFDDVIGAKHTWSSLYNLTGFAGLQVFLQAWCGGSTFLLQDDALSLSDKMDRMGQFQVTALSATPTMWRKILMTASSESLQTLAGSLQRVTLGGEIADQKVLDAISQQFPNAKVRQIYASTEAGVGFSVRDGRSGFPATYLTDPPNGVQVRVEGDRLLLRNPNSTQRFLDDQLCLHNDDGFIDTGDRVVQSGERYKFLGRANGCINVGGNKVQPEEVERFLLDCDGIVAARVYAKKSPFTGSLVAADVVVDSPNGDAALIRKSLMVRCREQLTAFKVPAVIRLVDAIETNASGKLKRSA